MSEYFLKLPGDSQPRAYSEYEVREFLGQGVIDSKTLTWKQGMEGWQPVAQVLPPMSPIWEETQDQESKDQPEEQQYRLRYPLNGLAKLSILACFVLLPFMLWSSWIVFSNNVVNYEEIQTLIQQNMVHLPSFAAPLVFLLSILFIPSLLIQLIWLYRASANIQEFQVQGIRFTPFLSVLLSCMPVVGMVLNALVLQEIYKASKKPGRMDAANTLPFPAIISSGDYGSNSVHPFPFRGGTLRDGLSAHRRTDDGSQHPVAGLCPANHQKTGGAGLQKSKLLFLIEKTVINVFPFSSEDG